MTEEQSKITGDKDDSIRSVDVVKYASGTDYDLGTSRSVTFSGDLITETVESMEKEIEAREKEAEENAIIFGINDVIEEIIEGVEEGLL